MSMVPFFFQLCEGIIKLFERKDRDHSDSQYARAIKQDNNIHPEWAELAYWVNLSLTWATLPSSTLLYQSERIVTTNGITHFREIIMVYDSFLGKGKPFLPGDEQRIETDEWAPIPGHCQILK